MDTFHMADIIPLLPLPLPPKGKSSYYVTCPQCDRSGKRDKHLNISLAKDVFRCPKCGWNGGIFDLYAYYKGLPRDNVRDELKRLLGGRPDKSKPKKTVVIETSVSLEQQDLQLAGIDIRHKAYSALLSLLSLAPDHRDNLINRGLSEQAIQKSMYRTTPVAGGKILSKQILSLGHSLEGVPGFYSDSEGQWTYISVKRGILIPVRDIKSRIQGLQVRLDNAEKRKYRWVSSGGIENGANGCSAEGWTHISGPVRDKILLIEGPLKADIVHHLTGQTVLAVPGVNSLKHLESALLELIEQGVKHVMTAFDMDFLANPHVQNGYTELVDLLGRLNIKYGTYMWNPEYNGLDDYVWECCLGNMQTKDE